MLEIGGNWRNAHPRHTPNAYSAFLYSEFRIVFIQIVHFSTWIDTEIVHVASAHSSARLPCDKRAAAFCYRKKFSHFHLLRSHQRICLHILKCRTNTYKKRIVDDLGALSSCASHSSAVISCDFLLSDFPCRAGPVRSRSVYIVFVLQMRPTVRLTWLTWLDWMAESVTPNKYYRILFGQQFMNATNWRKS